MYIIIIINYKLYKLQSLLQLTERIADDRLMCNVLENTHGSISVDVLVDLIDEHLLVTRVRISVGERLLVKFKRLVHILCRNFE